MIVWIRHGQSTWNALNRLQGQAAHPPLTDLGRAQSLAAAHDLAADGLTRIVSSPALRALQTAAIIGDHLTLPVESNPLLVEQGLDEDVSTVMTRVHTFVAGVSATEAVLAVSHGDTIALAVGMLTGTPPRALRNCDIHRTTPRR